eukprot:Anaeramoba_flamelloidesa93418_47.p2 GENE.a93418_47~~a93418_47.p2  ORF type:complete len:160 (-),score=11.62 a93418_47:72-551(-)
MDAGTFFRIGGDHQVQVATGEGRQRQETEAGGQVHFHLGPVLAKVVDGRHQPVEAAVTLDADVEAAGFAAGQSHDVALGTAHHRQQFIGQVEQPLSCAGKAERAGLADEQRAVEPLLQVLDLVGQGGLGQMNAFGRFDQAAGIAQGGQRFQMTNLDHTH